MGGHDGSVLECYIPAMHLSCIIVCCFPSKLDDDAYRMPAAVWIMVFWGCLQIAMYIWSVWQFAQRIPRWLPIRGMSSSRRLEMVTRMSLHLQFKSSVKAAIRYRPVLVQSGAMLPSSVINPLSQWLLLK